MHRDALHVTFVFSVTYLHYHMMNVLSLFGHKRSEPRCLKFDLTELFKIVNGFTTCRIDDCLQFAQTNSMHNKRRYRYKLYILFVLVKTLLSIIL